MLCSQNHNVADNVQNAIVLNPHVCQRKMEPQTSNGSVVLKGNVSSYYEKQMAQEAVMNVEGVERVLNQLEVNWS